MAAVVRDVDVKKLLNSFLHQEDSDAEYTIGSQSIEVGGGNCKATKPRNRHAFLQRVHTFTSMNWFAKPPWLSPLVCARYGWKNTGVDCLHCVSCGKYISGRIPSTRNPTVYDEGSKRVVQALKTGHTLACPWANCPSPEYFLKMPYETPQKALRMFKEHVSELVPMEHALPLITDDTLEALNLSVEKVGRLVELCLDNHDEDVLKSAAVLSMTGWSISSKKPNPMISCTTCNRQVGLWNFLSLGNPKPDDMDSSISVDDDSLGGQMLTITSARCDKEIIKDVEESQIKESPQSNPCPSQQECSPQTGVTNQEEKVLDSGDAEQECTVSVTGLCEQDGGISGVEKALKDQIDGESLIHDEAPASTAKITDNTNSEHPPPGEEEDIGMGTSFEEGMDEHAQEPHLLSTENDQSLSSSQKQSNLSVENDSAEGNTSGEMKLEMELSPSESDKMKVNISTSSDCIGESGTQSTSSPVDKTPHGITFRPNQSVDRLDGSLLLNFAVGETDESPDESSHGTVVCSPTKRPMTEVEVEEGEKPVAKRQKIEQKIMRTSFKPLVEHHSWCPWISPYQGECPRNSAPSSPVQEGRQSQDQPGWLQIFRFILPEFDPSCNSSILKANRTSPEALRSIRKLFNEWTSSAVSR